MEAIGTPADLLRVAERLQAESAAGFLLSGGCDRHGRVPLRPFMGAVRTIKAFTALRVNLHTGLLDDGSARELRECGADALSVDVVQDPATLSEVLHTDASPDDYARTLELLSGAPGLVPHICVGLQSEGGEERSLELVAGTKVSGLIALGLIGARGTPWDGRTVEGDRLVGFVRQAARSIDAPVLVGCMRPRGDWATEIRCLEAGAQGMVNPSTRTVAWAREQGFDVLFREECCSLHL